MDTEIKGGAQIARNTLLLYGRMLLLLVINLYTSRVILDALGASDFGIYEVVGGIVAMFTVLSGSLSSAISRFITFELGKTPSDAAKLKVIFANSIITQILIALLIAAIAEPVGLWALGGRLNIDPERVGAARWVLQFSIFAFAINLISIPYNAEITAHERMGAFAAVSLIEGLGKLGIAFAITASPIDRLVFYALLMAVLAVIVRLCYGLYCRRNFEECRGTRLRADRGVLREMAGFAGWNFIGASSAILRDQGGNILLNLFFGTAVNAARGVAMQVSKTVQGFVSNFMTALNPQVTKSYASGDRAYMMKLIFKGSRIACMMVLLLGLPILFNTEALLALWLKDVPEKTAILTRLAIIFAMSESISYPLITAMLATGDIKRYQLIVGGLQLLNLPVSWLCLKLGCGPGSILVVAIVISQICLGARLVLLKGMIGLDSRKFLKDVLMKLALVTIFSAGLSTALGELMPEGPAGAILYVMVCIAVTASVVWTVGLERDEKDMIRRKILHR